MTPERIFSLTIKNVWFYVGFVLVLGATMLFGSQPVLGFQRFPARLASENIELGEKTYVPKRIIGDVIVGSAYSNINVGDHKSSSIGATIDIGNFDKLMYLIQEMERLTKTNIGDMVKNSSDRANTLTLYKKQLATVLDTAGNIIPNLTNHIQNVQLEYNACKANKDQADASYAGGINTDNGSLIQLGYEDAKQYGTCVTEKRITINSYGPIRDKLLASQKVLQNQYDFIEKNFETLTTNDDLFTPGALEGMINVRDSISTQ